METQDTVLAVAQSMIAGVRNLPTPPLVFTRIVNVANDTTASADDIAAILSQDPAMAAKVLKIANSAYYGLSGTITSVKQAIVIVGLNGVKSLVVSASIINMFNGDGVGHEFQEEFWRHSLVTAFGSRMLMREMRPNDFEAGGLAFSAGLLHDIGKMVMYLHSPKDCQKILQDVRDGEADELNAERLLFGCDHALVGGVLAEKWNMPKELCVAITNHHQPLEIDDSLRLTDVIHVADGLAYHALVTSDGMLSAPPIEPGVFERNELKLEDLGDYLEKLKGEYVQAETFLKMARGDA